MLSLTVITREKSMSLGIIKEVQYFAYSLHITLEYRYDEEEECFNFVAHVISSLVMLLEIMCIYLC
jgi:hypothetical protein